MLYYIYICIWYAYLYHTSYIYHFYINEDPYWFMPLFDLFVCFSGSTLIESTLENYLVQEFNATKGQVTIAFVWFALAATPSSLGASYVCIINTSKFLLF